MSREIVLGARSIGAGQPVFIVAEAGVNHNGDPDMALAMVEAAAAAGADAVKFQAFATERLVSLDAGKAAYQESPDAPEESLSGLLKRLELPDAAYPLLMERCRKLGVGFLCTPFDETRADFLDALGVDGFKIGSGEVTNLAFLRHVAAKGKPVILSTGMSTLGETEAALAALSGGPGGAGGVALLHCLSAYPGDPAEANLRAMAVLEACFGVPVGFSDHTDTTWMAAAAVCAGACIVEKHFTLDRGLPGPDHKASLDPAGFRELVATARLAQAALGDGVKRVMPGEAGVRLAGRRSLATARDVKAGETIGADMLWCLRPAGGIAPEALELVAGRTARRDIPARTLLGWSDLS